MNKAWVAAAVVGWAALAGQAAYGLKAGTPPGGVMAGAQGGTQVAQSGATRAPGSLLPPMLSDAVTVSSIRWFGETTIRMKMKRYHDTEKNVLCYVTYVDWTGTLTVSGGSSAMPGFPAPGVSCVPVSAAPAQPPGTVTE